MKNILILLLFVCSATFGQMIRTLPPQLNGTCIQYAPKSGAKSVVIILPGKGELGSDPTIIESHIKVAAALKAGTFSVNRVILFQQLASSQGGFYGNTIGPLIAYAKTLGLPIDFSGLSLGGMGVGANLPYYPGVIRSAMTCPGKVEQNVAAGPMTSAGVPQWPAVDYVDAYRKVPSIHYYDPADLTIQDGYSSTKNLVTKLQTEGKKDISLIELPGYGHDVWDYAYSQANYWAWLDALDAPVQKPILDPVVKMDFDILNNVVIYTTQSGKVITIKPTTVN